MTAQAAPWTAEDTRRSNITIQMMSAVMSGSMARGAARENSRLTADGSVDRCLSTADRLLVVDRDYPAQNQSLRLHCATELGATIVANLIALGAPPDKAMTLPSRLRDHLFSSANSTAQSLVSANIARRASIPTAAPATDESDILAAMTVQMMSGLISGSMAHGLSGEDALSVASRSRDRCIATAGSLLDMDAAYGPAHQKVRLRHVAELVATTAANLVARGADPAVALMQASRSRESFFATATAAANAPMTQQSLITREPRVMRDLIEAYRADLSGSNAARSHRRSPLIG